jgi:hypothetical protein
MNDSDAIRQFLTELFTGKATDAMPRPAVVVAVAGSRALLAELDTISYLLTGELSMLKTQTDQLLTCQECLGQLDAYVEDWLTDEKLTIHYPNVIAHLTTCPSCHEQANLLYDLLKPEAQVTQGDAPTYLTFETWLQRQPAENRAELAEQPASLASDATLWQQLVQRTYRLTSEIMIVLARTGATFGELTNDLTPKVAPLAAYRNAQAASNEAAELVELPHSAANLVVKVRIGPVIEGAVTLVLEVSTISPPQPIAQARVTLRDASGELLEGSISDQDGLAVFRQLAPGKYQFQVEYTDQTWWFAVTLAT